MKIYTHLAMFSLVLASCGTAGNAATTLTPPPATTVTPTSVPPTSVVVTTPPDTTITPPTFPTPSFPPTTVPAPLHCADVDPGELGSGDMAFFVQCGDAVYPVLRTVEPADLEASLQLLADGLSSSELAVGLWSGFDAVTAELSASASVAGGVAHIDFRSNGEQWRPGSLAGTSAQLLSFLDPVFATVFAHPGVDRLDLSTLCWGEAACTGSLDRETWASTVFLNQGWITGGDCAVLDSWTGNGCFVSNYDFATAGSVVNVAADDTLNVRAAPGPDALILGELPPTARLTMSDRMARATDGSLWRLVQTQGGDVGWVNMTFVEPDELDGSLLVSLVRFATQKGLLDDVLLAESVDFGLGSEIVASIQSSDLDDRSAWIIDVPDFAGHAGPFDLLAQVARLTAFTVSVGPVDQCADDNWPAPPGYEEHLRITVQPIAIRNSTCLTWFGLQAFVGESQQVEAITLDLWEP